MNAAWPIDVDWYMIHSSEWLVQRLLLGSGGARFDVRYGGALLTGSLGRTQSDGNPAISCVNQKRKDAGCAATNF
jgi:hypothetical protein